MHDVWAGALEGSAMCYMGCDEGKGFAAPRLVPGRSRPKIDADLALIERHYQEPMKCGEWPGDVLMGVSLERLTAWNASDGIRDRARGCGILTSRQDAVLYLALAAYMRQTIVVREATRRVMYALEGCNRRTGMRGDVALPPSTSSFVPYAAVGWGRFAD